MDYETLRNSMTVQDATRVLKETNCYGTMDIAKNVILKALEQQPKTDTLDKIKAEIKELQLIGYATVDGKREIASRAVMQIIDKYKAEREE